MHTDHDSFLPLLLMGFDNYIWGRSRYRNETSPVFFHAY